MLIDKQTNKLLISKYYRHYIIIKLIIMTVTTIVMSLLLSSLIIYEHSHTFCSKLGVPKVCNDISCM